MSNSGKQSPLGVNALSSLLQDTGFNINSITVKYVGSSTGAGIYTPGEIVKNTCLRMQTYAINAAFNGGNVNTTTYNNLISIGAATSTLATLSITSTSTTFTVTHDPSVVLAVGTIIRIDGATPIAYNASWEISASAAGTFTVKATIDPGTATVQGTIYYNSSIPALGNAKALSYTWQGAPGWGGTLYAAGNAATQFGYNRLFAWQAYNDFNFNNGLPAYKDFLTSFMTAASFISSSNDAILAVSNSRYFLDGTYSNMDDLITGDISGVNLALIPFGQDLINSGRAINLATIDTFGLPSNLLQTLQQNNGLTKAVTLALIASGLTTSELGEILGNVSAPTIAQQKKMYNAFTIVLGNDLREVLVALNCKVLDATQDSLADLLNPLKLFPTSYASMTVPVYNTQPNTPTNSKTYYPIYGEGAVNPALSAPAIEDQIGTSPYASAQSATPYIATYNRTSTGTTSSTPYNNSTTGGATTSTASSAFTGFVTGGGVVVGPYDPNAAPVALDPNWDYSKVSSAWDFRNINHDREYFAKQYYEPIPTGVGALPIDTRRELLREYVAKYVPEWGPDAVIPTGPDGNISFTDPNMKLPEGLQTYIERIATERGYLDSGGYSTLPLDNYQKADQIARDSMQAARDAQTAREQAGLQQPYPGTDHYTGTREASQQAAASATNAASAAAASAAAGTNTIAQTPTPVDTSAPTTKINLEDDPGATSIADYNPTTPWDSNFSGA